MGFRAFLGKRRLEKNVVSYWRSKGAKIGENCEIYPTVSLGSEPYLITIGDHVRINSNVNLITHDGGVWVIRSQYEKYRNVDLFGRIAIGNNVHIGNNVIIMPNVKIGNNCIIGCGAIVTKDIPDNSVAVGIPAKIIEDIEEYLKKNEKSFIYTKGMSKNEKRKFLENRYFKNN